MKRRRNCPRLRRFCEAEGVTLYAALQSVFQIVLKTWTGSDDFLIGSAVANRRAHKSEGMLGMFVNTIPVRSCVQGDPSFRALLARTMDTLSDGYEHEEVPFERVVRALQPEREAGRNPLFQVAFSAHNSDVPSLRGPGFELALFEAYSNCTSKFDFDVVMIPRGFAHADSFTLLWTYALDLYRRDTIECLRDTYLLLLDRAPVRARCAAERPASAVGPGAGDRRWRRLRGGRLRSGPSGSRMVRATCRALAARAGGDLRERYDRLRAISTRTRTVRRARSANAGSVRGR